MSRAFCSANYTTATKVFRSAAAQIMYTAYWRELLRIRAVKFFLNINFPLSPEYVVRDFFCFIKVRTVSDRDLLKAQF